MILLLALTSGAGLSPVLIVVSLVLVGMIAFNLWVAFAPAGGRATGQAAVVSGRRAHRAAG